MTLKASKYENTFDWIENGKIVASITLYPEGLVEFSGIHSVAIECVGDSVDEAVVID